MATKKTTETAKSETTEKQIDENLAKVLYDKLRDVPKEALKTINAGRLKNMSDINPMWRIQRMTEVFGTCGIGWKYSINKQWTETFGNETKAYCNIDLFVKIDGEWSEAIPGTGGSSEVTMERNGVYVSDEGYKMALTDALSVAMKALGVAADVYYAKGKNIVDPSTKYNMQEQQASGQLPVQSNPNTGQQQGINPEDIFQAQEYLAKATTKEQLQWIATTFKPLLKDPVFLTSCTNRKKELGIQ